MGVLNIPPVPAVPAIVPSTRSGIQPLQVAVLGPPGCGKTKTILRMMAGVQRVRKGPIVLIDTEAGRSKKYSPLDGETAHPPDTYAFHRMDLDEPYRSDRCLLAIKEAQKLNPAAIGFDSLSDEHEGEGGYMEWAASEVKNSGGNEYAAYNKPAAARKRLVTALQHMTVPLFLSFRGKEKSMQEEVDDPKNPGRKKKVITQMGWMPVAPLLILKGCDLTCILPWDSKGVPVWQSDKLGEDFIRKWPDYLVNIIKEGQLNEDTGEALARWAMGETVKPAPKAAAAVPSGTPLPTEDERLEAARLVMKASALLKEHGRTTIEQAATDLAVAYNGKTWKQIQKLSARELQDGLAILQRNLDGVAAMRERQPGEDE